MRILVTNPNLGFPEGTILENAEIASPIFGGYTGYFNNTKALISEDDGAIIIPTEEGLSCVF